MIAAPPLPPAVQASDTWASPAVARGRDGLSGGLAPGVPVTTLDQSPSPAELDARTRMLYSVPFVSWVIEWLVPVVVAWRVLPKLSPPDFHCTVYPEIAGPRLAGAAQETLSCPTPFATAGAGAAGRGCTAAEAGLAPMPLTARTLKLQTRPPDTPVTVPVVAPAPGMEYHAPSNGTAGGAACSYCQSVIERSPGLVQERATLLAVAVFAESPAGAAGAAADGAIGSDSALSAPAPTAFTPRTLKR